MNLDELARGLHSQADGVDDPGITARLTSLQTRIRAARRRRATGAGGFVAAAVVIGAVVASGAPGSRTTTPPIAPAEQPETSGTVIVPDSHPDYAPRVGSMTLIGGATGEVGADEATLTLDVPTNRVKVAVWCVGEASRSVRYLAAIGGGDGAPDGLLDRSTGRCESTRPEQFIPQDVALGYWAGGSGPPAPFRLDLPASGGRVTVTTRLEGAPPGHDLRIFMAVYDVPEPEATVSGLELYPLFFDGKRTLELFGYGTNPIGGDSATVVLPATQLPIQGFYMYSIEGPASGQIQFLVDGAPAKSLDKPGYEIEFDSETGALGGGGQLNLDLVPGRSHEVVLRFISNDPAAFDENAKVGLNLVFYTDREAVPAP